MQEILFEQNAERYSLPDAVSRFVPNIVWDKVRTPNNQLLFGGIGTGKTMLLRRLSWPAMLRVPDYPPGQEFAAFYCDMRELEDLHPLFSETFFLQDQRRRTNNRAIARYYATLHLLHVIADTLEEVQELIPPEQYNVLTESLLRTSRLSLGHEVQVDPRALGALISEKKFEIVASVASVSRLAELYDLAARVSAPEQMLRLFCTEVRRRMKMRIGFLLDQYEMLPAECHAIFNPLMKRENSSLFFTQVAARPFSFSPAFGDEYIQPTEDFDFTVVEYMPEDRDAYMLLTASILHKLGIKEGASRFEGGLDYLAEMSARSVRRFLNLCQSAGLFDFSAPAVIDVDKQRHAARYVSGLVRDELKCVSGVTQGAVWELVLRVARNAVHAEPTREGVLPGIITISSQSLFGMDNLTAESVKLMKKAFEESALQFVSRADARSFSLPDRFAVAPILTPSLKSQIDPHFEMDLPDGEIHEIAERNPKHPGGQHEPREMEKELRKVFLSISFADLPEPMLARDLFGQVFRESGVQVIQGQAVGPALITQLLSQIQDTQLTLIELSHLRPNIVLELGMTLGILNRIVPIRMREADTPSALSNYPFLLDMAHIEYGLDREDLRRLLKEVKMFMRRPPNKAHLLEVSLDGNVRLRVKQQTRTVALYYPPKRAALWKEAVPHIRRIVESSKSSLFVANEMPHNRGLSVLENLVWIISKADRVIIDTSGRDEPDLLGAFALGYAFATSRKKQMKQIVRLEEITHSHGRLISVWPSQQYKIWSHLPELYKIIKDFVVKGRK